MKGHEPGLHILGDWYDCKGLEFFHRLTAPEHGERRDQVIVDNFNMWIRSSGLTAVANAAHIFEQPTGGIQGFTAIIALQESHLSIHTWPEKGYVTIDVFVCNVTENNRLKAEDLYNKVKSCFQPTRVSERWIDRD